MEKPKQIEQIVNNSRRKPCSMDRKPRKLEDLIMLVLFIEN